MRIVIDLQSSQGGSRGRGIGRYSLSLARAMARKADGREIWITASRAFPETLHTLYAAFDGLVPPERIRCFSIPCPAREIAPANTWRTRAAERMREAFLADLQPDIVFVSSLFEGLEDDVVTSVGLQQPELTTAVTLYDLIPLLNPETYLGAPEVRAWYDRKIASLRRADLLLAISDHARKEVMEALNIPGERVVNISAAASGAFRPTLLAGEARRKLMERYAIDRPFLMYHGAFEPRKNIARLLEAFARLPAELRNAHDLLCSGGIGEPARRQLQLQAENLGIASRFRLPGYLPDEDLVGLYSHTALFVFPSLHEGFGLPALEAMACGAPVIGSDATSIPEVIGRADALFAPANVGAMAEKISEGLTNENFRRALREHGLARAKGFSWKACADRALAAIDLLAERKKQPAPHGMPEPPVTTAAPRPAWLAKRHARTIRQQALSEALVKLSEETVPGDDDLVLAARAIQANRRENDNLLRVGTLPESLSWRIEGPFDSSYSLALLNRETARALCDLGHKVILHSTEGPGDYPPDPDFLSANPDLARMHARSRHFLPAEGDVVSRNLYPPRVQDMTGRFNLLHHYAWEESGFPPEWAASFNENLQGVTCLSRHVEKILTDHGVSVPLYHTGCGVDHWQRIEADNSFHMEGLRAFRFLHVSSCFPRKGADILLEAYGRAFSAADDVTLVIKTFVNPHNRVARQLARLRLENPDFPHVRLYEEELSDAQLKALYRQCQVLVAPSRAEGFGLPLAEAMLSGLAVITTDWGGQRDFCNKDTAWLLDYRFAPAQTHFNLFDSVWAEPDAEQLTGLMRALIDLPEEERTERADAGRRFLLARSRWQDVARLLTNATRSLAESTPTPVARIGWVTTWNTACGIASYSAHLLGHLPTAATVLAGNTEELLEPDGTNVVRCWTACGHMEEGDPLSELAGTIAARSLNTLVIQFNYGFFHLGHFSRFLEGQLAAGRVVVLMLHSTVDRPLHLPQGQLKELVPALAECHRICVHSVADLNRLKQRGIVDNVTLFPHGIPDHTPPPAAPRPQGTPILLASYGFFLPHKGLLELIEAVHHLVQAGKAVELLMVNARYPVPQSDEIIEEARRRIETLGLAGRVRIESRYLEETKSLDLLSAADLVIFPYQETGESSSAAVRMGLVCGRPVAVTPLPIFADVSQAVFTLPGTAPELIAKGIDAILSERTADTPGFRAVRERAGRWLESHRHSRLAPRLHGMLLALHRKNNRSDRQIPAGMAAVVQTDG